jgi:hypothetical protein
LAKDNERSWWVHSFKFCHLVRQTDQTEQTASSSNALNTKTKEETNVREKDVKTETNEEMKESRRKRNDREGGRNKRHFDVETAVQRSKRRCYISTPNVILLHPVALCNLT